METEAVEKHVPTTDIVCKHLMRKGMCYYGRLIVLCIHSQETNANTFTLLSFTLTLQLFLKLKIMQVQYGDTLCSTFRKDK